MAQKKGGGSTRNGRDSKPKMLGVKAFGGETFKIRQTPSEPSNGSPGVMRPMTPIANRIQIHATNRKISRTVSNASPSVYSANRKCGIWTPFWPGGLAGPTQPTAPE